MRIVLFRSWNRCSAGQPVIGANAGGVPELIEAGRTGELFECGDADQLAERISSFWKEPGRLAEYTENCGKVKFDSLRNIVLNCAGYIGMKEMKADVYRKWKWERFCRQKRCSIISFRVAAIRERHRTV